MEREPFLAWDGFEYIDVQNEAGIDVEQIRANLKLTPTQRLKQHEAWVQFIWNLKHAAKTTGPQPPL